MSYSRERNRRQRSRDNPSWYDESLAAMADQEEVIEIPEVKVGLVIGKQGRKLQEIREQSGVQISVKDSRVHLRGTTEQRQKAKTIIEGVLHSKSQSHEGGFKMLRNLKVPVHVMGYVLGKGRENLRKIETNVGVALKVDNNTFSIKRATEKEEKLAEREIKTKANVAMKRGSQKVHFTKFVHVDTAQLEENHEFKLEETNASLHLGETYYKLKLLEHPLQEESYSDFSNIDRIREKVLEVLKQIHREKDEEEVRVDMWCHFGHCCVTQVDEDELEETFTLKEIKERLETAENKTWKPFFKEGIKEMEVEEIEKNLPSKAAKEDIRYDFTFYTPTCRDVRVKAWLIEPEAEQGEGGEAASSFTFSRQTPVPVKNILTRVLSDEQGDTSNTPCFHICAQPQGRMKVDILIPSKDLDCRLSIRTSTNYAPKTLQDKEEDKILETYLMGMKIENAELTLPPASELQEGFDLFYQRRSLRRTYEYEMEGEQFTLTVCKDQAENVCPYEPDASNIHDIPAKADIHLHCEEWDRVFDEGDWEPEQIVAKLPNFLKFLRKVQRNVSP